MKGSIYQEDITLIACYAPKYRAPKHIKQKWSKLKGELGNSTIIITDFNTLLSIRDRTKKRINKEREDINNSIYQLPNRYSWNTPPPNDSRIYRLPKCTGNILRDRSCNSYKMSLNMFKRNKIIQCIFSNCNGMELERNN